MKFSTRATYGLRALIQIANNHDGPTSVGQIAKLENLSSDYLERLVSRLKKHGIIKSSKGSNGGYELAKPVKEINLLEILQALEGFKSSFSCSANPGDLQACNKGCHCSSDNILSFIQASLNKTLINLSLADLIKIQK